MKKEVENKKPFITDLSSSESSGDESEKEIPIEKEDELKKEIEKLLLTDNKPKTTTPIKPKKVKKRESSSSNSDDQEKPVIPIKPKKSSPKVTHKKILVKGDDFKKLQKKAKTLGATSLDYSKKIHFGSANTEDYLTHNDPDRREKYLTKAMKITNKNGDCTYLFPEYPNYWSIKLLN